LNDKKEKNYSDSKTTPVDIRMTSSRQHKELSGCCSDVDLSSFTSWAVNITHVNRGQLASESERTYQALLLLTGLDNPATPDSSISTPKTTWTLEVHSCLASSKRYHYPFGRKYSMSGWHCVGSILYMLMPWWWMQPGHQQVWYWPNVAVGPDTWFLQIFIN